jgi:hypothetical protein
MAHRLGPRYVPCQVTDRYLEFPELSAGKYGGGEFIAIQVMTLVSGKPKRICEVILTREQLQAALEACKSPA